MGPEDLSPRRNDLDAYRSCTDDDLETLVGQLLALLMAVFTTLLEVLSVLREREPWRRDDLDSGADWLAARFGLKRRTAWDYLRMAKALRSLPAIREAAALGRLSTDQLRPITRFATPEEDARLAADAPALSPGQLDHIARRRRRISAAASEAEREKRSLRLRWDDERRWLHLWGHLPAEDGHLVEATLEPFARDQPPDPATGSLLPRHQQLADGLVDMAAAALTAPDRARAPTPAVTVHVDAEVMTGGEGRATLQAGGPVPAETARRLGCDARMRLVAERDGAPVGIGRASRSVPPFLAEVVWDAWGCCGWPGCTRAFLCDLHHVRPRAEGGPTDVDNLVPVCRPHHRALHEGGFRLARTPQGGLVAVHPNGTVLGTGPPRLRPELERWLGRMLPRGSSGADPPEPGPIDTS